REGPGIRSIRDQPNRRAVFEDSGSMLDTALRVEHEQFGAVTGAQAGHRLRSDRIQPAQPIFAGDLDHQSISERRGGAARDQPTLLPHRVAEVKDDATVDDRTGKCGEDVSECGHAQTLPKRAEACDASSAPSAAISQAQSRWPWTSPYMRLAAPYSWPPAPRTIASVAMSMRGPLISPR